MTIPTNNKGGGVLRILLKFHGIKTNRFDVFCPAPYNLGIVFFIGD